MHSLRNRLPSSFRSHLPSGLGAKRLRGALAAFVLASALASNANGQPAFPNATFEKIGDMAIPETPFGFALPESPLDDAAYLFGGSSTSGVWTRAARRYSLADASWTILPTALPYPWYNNERHNAALAANGKVYIGPGNGPGGWGQHQRILEFDPTTSVAVERAYVVAPGANVWGVAIAPAPASRGGVYLLGGWNGGGLSQVRHYDPDSDQMTTVGYLSAARTVGARVTHPNGRVYVFGGNTYGTLSAVDMLDMTNETVRPVANPLGFRFVHGTLGWVGEDGLIYLWNPNGAFMGMSSDRIIRFDPAGETFEIAGDSPLPTGLPASVFPDLVRGRVLFFGLTQPGYIWGEAGVTLGEVWQLSPVAENQPPVAAAGSDLDLAAGAACLGAAHLDATGSFDPDGDPLSFLWMTQSGVFPDAVVDLPLPLGEHALSLHVSDGRGGEDDDDLLVRVSDLSAPILALHGPQQVEVECGGTFADPGAQATDNCDPQATLTSVSNLDLLTPGLYTIRYSASDDAGNQAVPAERLISVIDTQAPSVPEVAASPSLLWPPNHRMVLVSIAASSADLCSSVTTCGITSVTSNESVNGGGDGDTGPDWEIVGPLALRLRAERSGSGSGRVYTVFTTCSDSSGNSSVGFATVRVPKSQSGR